MQILGTKINDFFDETMIVETSEIKSRNSFDVVWCIKSPKEKFKKSPISDRTEMDFRISISVFSSTFLDKKASNGNINV